jgi:pyruvate carboxylase
MMGSEDPAKNFQPDTGKIEVYRMSKPSWPDWK